MVDQQGINCWILNLHGEIGVLTQCPDLPLFNLPKRRPPPDWTWSFHRKGLHLKLSGGCCGWWLGRHVLGVFPPKKLYTSCKPSTGKIAPVVAILLKCRKQWYFCLWKHQSSRSNRNRDGTWCVQILRWFMKPFNWSQLSKKCLGITL